MQSAIGSLPVEADEPLRQLRTQDKVFPLLHVLSVPQSRRDAKHVLPPSGVEIRSALRIEILMLAADPTRLWRNRKDLLNFEFCIRGRSHHRPQAKTPQNPRSPRAWPLAFAAHRWSNLQDCLDPAGDPRDARGDFRPALVDGRDCLYA